MMRSEAGRVGSAAVRRCVFSGKPTALLIVELALVQIELAGEIVSPRQEYPSAMTLA